MQLVWREGTRPAAAGQQKSSDLRRPHERAIHDPLYSDGHFGRIEGYPIHNEVSRTPARAKVAPFCGAFVPVLCSKARYSLSKNNADGISLKTSPSLKSGP